MIGAGDAFLTTLTGLVRRLPVFPLFGDGSTRLQPVFVGDVAEAAATALAGPDPRPGIHELGGPEVLTYRDPRRIGHAPLRPPARAPAGAIPGLGRRRRRLPRPAGTAVDGGPSGVDEAR